MSVIYFIVGVLIGFGMLLWPSEAGYYIPVHVHLNLLGFMSMMIYGVGYHILPKFSGRPIFSQKIMKVQFWLANIGLVIMSVSWPFVIREESFFPETTLILSALLSMVAVFLFAINILKTIKSI
jgi:nitric oxide reductase large subunit